jgi:hypothetical protein
MARSADSSKSGGYGPFGAIRVERLKKADGRAILYYSWAESTPEPPPERRSAQPRQHERWSPEGGPAAGEDEDGPRS